MGKYGTSAIWLLLSVVSLLLGTSRFVPEVYAILATVIGAVAAAASLVMFFSARARQHS